jgi:hypothetical protein
MEMGAGHRMYLNWLYVVMWKSMESGYYHHYGVVLMIMKWPYYCCVSILVVFGC